MNKFVQWLKFYFLGFFSNEISKEGADRRFVNTLLSFILTFVIICCGLIAGYTASFGLNYSKADGFKDFLYSALADETNPNRINLKMSDGKLSAEIPGGRQYVNSLIEDGGYDKNGYKLIMDTRPSSETFAEFTITCKDSAGKDIGYEAYRELTDEGKKNIALGIEFSGKALDVTARQTEYIAFLEKVSAPGTEDYNEEIANAYGKLEPDGAGYANALYALYVKAYYSAVNIRDSYGAAPTLKTYYLASGTYENVENYAVILDDVCFCSFKTNDGTAMQFSGYYTKISDGEITANGLTAQEMQKNIDGFIKNAFHGGSGLNFLVYFISAGRIAGLYLAAVLVIALLAFVICKYRKSEICFKYMEMLKILGSYLLVSSVISFIGTVICSLFLPRGTVFNLAGIIFIAVFAVRTAVLITVELIKERKNRKAAESSDSAL